MSRFLNKSVETYIVDTEDEVMELQEEVRNARDFIVKKFNWAHKETKTADYYLVTIEKIYETLDSGVDM